MYHLKGDVVFNENVVFNETECLNQQLCLIKWNLAYFSRLCHELSLIILKSRDHVVANFENFLFHLASY